MRSAILVALAAASLACVGSQPNLPPVICTNCGSVCVDLQTDSANCGACAKACPGGQLCKAGACVATCPSGMVLCGGVCVDPKASASFCGAKGDCTTEDASNSKGKDCGKGHLCAAGVCVSTCGTAQIACGGTCIDPTSDRSYCGAKGDCATEDDNDSAGQACTGAQSCVAGVCKVVCAKSETVCGGACVTTDSDPQNCGGCGNACAQGLVCSAGSCTQVCREGWLVCDSWTGLPGADAGTPGRDAATPDSGAASTDGGALDGGAIRPDAGSSFPPPRACVNPDSDDHNCGKCGALCEGSRSCVHGVCAYPTSCADLQSKKGLVVDAEYLIDPDGDGPLKPFSVYCRNMSTPTPKAYLTFVHSVATDELGANRIVYGAGNPCGTASCPPLYVYYTRVPIDTDALVLGDDDAAYAYLDDFEDPGNVSCWLTQLTGPCVAMASNPRFGSLLDCASTEGEVPSEFDLNLVGTGFILDPSVEWIVSPSTPYGPQVQISQNGAVVSVLQFNIDDSICITAVPQPGLKLQQQ